MELADQNKNRRKKFFDYLEDGIPKNKTVNKNESGQECRRQDKFRNTVFQVIEKSLPADFI